MTEKQQIAGNIYYYGGASFSVEFGGEHLFIDPDLRWLYTSQRINKKDPLTLSMMDTFKQKMIGKKLKNTIMSLDKVDFILITSPNYPFLDQLKDIAEYLHPLFIIVPKELFPKIKMFLPEHKKQNIDLISMEIGEILRFSHFHLHAVATEKERPMIGILSDADKNGQSYIIHCGKLQLFYATRGSGLPIHSPALNTAILPMNYSRYYDPAFLQKFIERFSPDLIIPYLYEQKSAYELKQFHKQQKNAPNIHFAQIGEAIPWN